MSTKFNLIQLDYLKLNVNYKTLTTMKIFFSFIISRHRIVEYFTLYEIFSIS